MLAFIVIGRADPVVGPNPVVLSIKSFGDEESKPPSGAIAGGVAGGNPDYLSDISAWLYWSFWNGTLGTAVTYDSTINDHQTNLQNLIWWEEEEITSKPTDTYKWYEEATTAVGSWTNTGQVMVVNLYNQRTWNGTEYEYFELRQDVLIAAVPEPATMLLLGSGLFGLAVLGRKKLFKKA